MDKYPNPCDTCEKQKAGCPHHCEAWRIRYLYRQNQINAYARQHGIVPGAPDYTKGRNPCEVCPQNEKCTTICRARADYWGDRMKLVRKGLGLDE